MDDSSDCLNERMKVYEEWVHTAEVRHLRTLKYDDYRHQYKACRRLNNFSSTSAIVIALMSPIVTALTLTRGSKAKALYKLAKDLTPTNGVYQNTLEKVATKDLIPWLGTVGSLRFFVSLPAYPTCADRHLSTLNSSFARSNPIVEVDGHSLIDFKQCSKIAEEIESLVQYSPPRTRDTTQPNLLAYVERNLKSSSGDGTVRAAEERSAKLAADEQTLSDHQKRMQLIGVAWSPPAAAEVNNLVNLLLI
jgi:hypothetical protein